MRPSLNATLVAGLFHAAASPGITQSAEAIARRGISVPSRPSGCRRPALGTPAPSKGKVRGNYPFRAGPLTLSVNPAMPSYLVESYHPQGRSAALPEAAARARRAAQGLRAEGKQVRYLRSALLPGDELCLHLFEADSATLVSQASERAGISPERVVETVLGPDSPRQQSKEGP